MPLRRIHKSPIAMNWRIFVADCHLNVLEEQLLTSVVSSPAIASKGGFCRFSPVVGTKSHDPVCCQRSLANSQSRGIRIGKANRNAPIPRTAICRVEKGDDRDASAP
jgi:hypothetical protein